MATQEEVDPLNLTTKDFGKKLDQLAKYHNQILKLAAKVYSLGKTQRLQYPNGQQVGRKELRTLSSQYGKELKALRKHYTAHGRRRKRTRKEGGSAGFKNSILVTDNMRDFFKVANLGPEDPTVPGSPPLNQQLAVAQHGVTTRAMLTSLFTIYAYINNMQQDPEHKAFLTATPQMNQYFSDTFAILAAEPQKMTTATAKSPSKPIPRFDPNKFYWNRLQSIVKYNAVKKEALTPEQQAILQDPATYTRLAEEQKIASRNLRYWKQKKKEQREAAGL